jgi:hypothetical protein
MAEGLNAYQLQLGAAQGRGCVYVVGSRVAGVYLLRRLLLLLVQKFKKKTVSLSFIVA